MTQAKIINGDLHLIFRDVEDDNAIVYTLDNGAKLEFVDDKFTSLILPNFEEQLGRGSLLGLEVNVNDISLDGMTIVFSLNIQGHTVNGRVDCSSLE